MKSNERASVEARLDLLGLGRNLAGARESDIVTMRHVLDLLQRRDGLQTIGAATTALEHDCTWRLAWETLRYRLGDSHPTLEAMDELEASHAMTAMRAREAAANG
jgi:hypothetical protein